MTEKPLCFVIGPIGEAGTATRQLADWLLLGLFKPVLEAEEFGYRVKRADEDASPGSIADAMILDVLDAPLVIADLTAHNANGFYELALRHMAEKPVILVTADGRKPPFDNQSERTIFVDIADIRTLHANEEQLREAVRIVRADGYRVSNPVTHARGHLALAQSADPRDQQFADLQDRVRTIERGLAHELELARRADNAREPPEWTNATPAWDRLKIAMDSTANYEQRASAILRFREEQAQADAMLAEKLKSLGLK